MQRRHGESFHHIVGEGVFSDTGEIRSRAFAAMDVPANAASSGSTERLFRFGRLFREEKLEPFRPERSKLVELGLAMHADDDPQTNDDPGVIESLPAGYTYLGQFIDHDVTFDRTQELPEGLLTLDQVQQGRSPSLDLDSLYGNGPLSESSRKLYQDDRLRLKIGKTSPTVLGNATDEFENDLSREGKGAANPLAAIIGDARNDGNLALAQTHLAFHKFHNAVVKHLAAQGLFGKDLFEAARDKVTRHFQWIVLHDFLDKVIDRDILKEVIDNGPTYFKTPAGEEPVMPVECSAAAFRLGHSMVRDSYEWNRVFPSPPEINTPVARLRQLARLTGLHGDLDMNPTLPSNWVIDWTRFFDFIDFAGVVSSPKLNKARKIVPWLTKDLRSLSGFPNQGLEFRSLSVRNLVRGSILGLPTGQDVAKEFKKKFEFTPLTAPEIAQGPHQEVLTRHGFDTQTPLWYYILKEAEVKGGGNRLGPVGSRIVTETFVGLILASRTSILRGTKWEPDLGREAGKFSMAELLFFAADSTNYLNPLG